MVDRDKRWVNCARKFDNFYAGSLAGFYFDQTPVSAEMARFNAAQSEYALPLSAGNKDLAQCLSDVQKAFEKAGYEKVDKEYQSQTVSYSKQ